MSTTDHAAAIRECCALIMRCQDVPAHLLVTTRDHADALAKALAEAEARAARLRLELIDWGKVEMETDDEREAIAYLYGMSDGILHPGDLDEQEALS